MTLPIGGIPETDVEIADGNIKEEAAPQHIKLAEVVEIWDISHAVVIIKTKRIQEDHEKKIEEQGRWNCRKIQEDHVEKEEDHGRVSWRTTSKMIWNYTV